MDWSIDNGLNVLLEGVVLVVVFVFLTVPVNFVHAQDQRADQMQQLRRLIEKDDVYPEDYRAVEDEGEPESEVDQDLGRQRILRRRKDHKYYSASASLTFQNSNNVTLAPDPQPQNVDGSRVASVSGNYHFNVSSPYTARAGLSYQSVAYRDEEGLNYDFFSGTLLGRRQLQTPGLRTSAGLEYKFQSLLYGTENPNNSQTDSVYDQHVLTADMRTLYPLSRFEFLTGSISLSDETTTNYEPIGGTDGLNDPEKTSFKLNSAYRYQYSQRISYSASYQYKRDWYEHQKESLFGAPIGDAKDRMDYSHLLSAGVQYKWMENLNLGFNLSYNENHSNHQGPTVGNNQEYDSFTASFSLSTRTRFKSLSNIAEKF